MSDRIKNWWNKFLDEAEAHNEKELVECLAEEERMIHIKNDDEIDAELLERRRVYIEMNRRAQAYEDEYGSLDGFDPMEGDE